MENKLPVIPTVQAKALADILVSKNTREVRIAKIENLISRKVGKKVKFLLDKALELADGIYMVDQRDPQKIKYYKKAPDLDAIEYLIDRLVGKPVAKAEIKDDTNRKGVVTIQNMIVQLAGSPPAGTGTLGKQNNENENGTSNPGKQSDTVTLSPEHVRFSSDSLQE